METPQITFETINPAIAKDWLENNNTNNRTIKKAHVIRLARDMKNGNWQGGNGETIKFDGEGRLIDGQHRLAACVRSDSEFQSIVVRSVPAESYITVGTGIGKSTADFLHPNGHKNAAMLAATAKLVHLWQNGKLNDIRSGENFPTTSQVFEVIENNPRLAESVHFVAGGQVKKSSRRHFAP